MIEHFYVYALIDPRDGSVFYVGKGIRQRMYDHQAEVKRNSRALANDAKVARIRAILAAGLEVEHQMLACCATDADAYHVERLLIAEHRSPALTNANSGRTGGYAYRPVRVAKDPFSVAKRMFDSIQPFSDWLRRDARSNEDVRIYWFVHDSLMDVMKLCRPIS